MFGLVENMRYFFPKDLIGSWFEKLLTGVSTHNLVSVSISHLFFVLIIAQKHQLPFFVAFKNSVCRTSVYENAVT